MPDRDQKFSLQSAQQLNDGSSFDKRLLSGLYFGSSSSDHYFSVNPDQEACMNNSFTIGSCGSNSCEPADISSTGEQASQLGNAKKLPFRSDVATGEEHSSLLGIIESPQALLKDSNFIGKLFASRGHLEVEGRKYGSKSQGIIRSPVTEIQNGIVDQAHLAANDLALSMHSSLSVPCKFKSEFDE